MNIEDIKSFSEAVREILHLDYYNAGAKNKLIKYCNSKGIDIQCIIENNRKKLQDRKNFCKNCGKEISLYKKFCDSSCAATYNNKKRKLKQETKDKISESLKKVKRNSECKYNKNGKKIYKKICKVCGKEFETVSKNATHCSKKCVGQDTEYREHLRNKQLALVKQGKHKGWITRNIVSFPERFWMRVLNSNNIEYVHNYHFYNKYFLDFYIIKNGNEIDLEIDGKQHEDRKEEDDKRDDFVKDKNVIVYRVKWNYVNNDKGKEIMKKKIDDFLNFYNNIN